MASGDFKVPGDITTVGRSLVVLMKNRVNILLDINPSYIKQSSDASVFLSDTRPFLCDTVHITIDIGREFSFEAEQIPCTILEKEDPQSRWLNNSKAVQIRRCERLENLFGRKRAVVKILSHYQIGNSIARRQDVTSYTIISCEMISRLFTYVRPPYPS